MKRSSIVSLIVAATIVLVGMSMVTADPFVDYMTEYGKIYAANEVGLMMLQKI
jgi:hypothetical protein